MRDGQRWCIGEHLTYSRYFRLLFPSSLVNHVRVPSYFSPGTLSSSP